MSTYLTYRSYRECDLPGVLRLWEEEAGWGSLTPETWRQWYIDTPHGPCTTVVGVDDAGQIAGQEIFTPSVLTVGGCEVRALRLSAPILAKSLRSGSARSREHPVIRLYVVGAEAAAAAGFGLVYALPEHAWLPFFRWSQRLGIPRGDFAISEYRCVALPLASIGATVARASRGLLARQAEDFGADYDELWQTAVDTFPIQCGVVRSRSWLRFKNGGRIMIETREPGSGALVGYAAIKRKTGLIADILARSPGELPAVLAACAGAVAEAQHAGTVFPFAALQAMETSTLRPALHELGFEPVAYKFAFVCATLDPGLSCEAVMPDRWYVNPGD
ncbi:MAG: hypothetical protein WKG32_19225 [Gemmatimonadaceae bacterium]